MSYPTKLSFLKKDLTVLSEQDFDAGWFVERTVGVKIALGHASKEWDYFIVYDTICCRDGFPLGGYEGAFLWKTHNEYKETRKTIEQSLEYRLFMGLIEMKKKGLVEPFHDLYRFPQAGPPASKSQPTEIISRHEYFDET